MKDIEEYITESHKHFFENDNDPLNKKGGKKQMARKKRKCGRRKRRR